MEEDALDLLCWMLIRLKELLESQVARPPANTVALLSWLGFGVTGVLGPPVSAMPSGAPSP